MYDGTAVSYALDEQPFSARETLMQAVSHIAKEKPLFIAVDKQAPSEELVRLLADLSQQNRQIANILIEHK
jgi:biopolymer transport protein ExbD